MAKIQNTKFQYFGAISFSCDLSEVFHTISSVKNADSEI